MTCSRFSLLKTWLMTTEANFPCSRSVLSLLSMAAFHSIIYGRFWVITKEVKNVSVLVAIGVAQSGYREILGVSEGAKEDKASWTNFLRELKQRGLKGVQLFVSDKCLVVSRFFRTL